MRNADAGARPNEGKPLVVSEEHVVESGAGQQSPYDVRHPVIELVPDHGGSVEAGDAQPVRGGRIP